MIRDLKPYVEYKDSGSLPLGRVPVHWQIRSMGSLTSPRSERNRADLPLLSVVREKGVILRSRSGDDDNHNFIPDDLSNYKAVRKGDLVINKMKAWQGSLGIAPQEGIVSPAYYIFDFFHPVKRYSHLLLRSKPYVALFGQESDGVRVGQWDLSIHGMKRIPVLVPPIEECAAIVRFLDHADQRIRRAIRAKRKLIALLNEQTQVIIHQAVTRGLDPKVRLKPSGVEWLGNVPEHWEVIKLRKCGSIEGGLTPSMEIRHYWDGDIPWVTPKDMKRAAIGDSSVRVSQSAIQETSLRLIEPPAILMVVRGMILARRVPIACTTAPVTINQDMKALKTMQGISAEFLARYLDSAQEAFKPLIDEAGHGTRRLPMERWRNMAVVLPPKDEQIAIIRFLDTETHAIDIAVDRSRSEIDLLLELRARLISDVVTGKLDVRQAAAQLPSVTDTSEAIDDTEALSEDEEAPEDAESEEVEA